MDATNRYLDRMDVWLSLARYATGLGKEDCLAAAAACLDRALGLRTDALAAWITAGF